MDMFFAYVGAEDDTFILAYARKDEVVISVTLDQSEGNYAALSVTIVNPREGILAPHRKRYVWLSYDDGSSIVPLLFGEIAGFPEDITGETVQLLIIAKPVDVDDQKEALAATLRDFPYVDHIWINPEDVDNPDIVLDARPYRWHYDRLTHLTTISHIIHGEDGILDFTENQILYDGSTFTYSDPPLTRLDIEGQVNWTQSAQGQVNLTRKLLDAGVAAGSNNPHMFQSYTADGLVSDWPLPDADIGGGWKVFDSNVVFGYRMPYYEDEIELNVYIEPEPSDDGVSGLVNSLVAVTPKRVKIKRISMAVSFIVQYDAERSRTETVRFTLVAPAQTLVTEAGVGYEKLQLRSNDVSEFVDDTFDTDTPAIPIGDVRRNSYFKTDRGKPSIEHLIARGATRMLRRSRAVELTFTTKFDLGVAATLRKECHIIHRNLPGGEAVGKIIAYRLHWDGDSGSSYAQITMGCSVGYGGTVVENLGEPTYCDDDYCETDYQARSNEQRAVLPNVVYSVDSITNAVVDDDGLDFIAGIAADDALQEPIQVTNGPQVQKDRFQNMRNLAGSQDEIVSALREVSTRVCVHLKPVTGGPFETFIDVIMLDIKLPRGIDLEASSTN